MSSPIRYRLVLYLLLAFGLYKFGSYHYYSPVESLFDPQHSVGTLGHGVVLKDGRKSVSRRTVAVADLHGDLEHTLNVLRMASLISPNNREWIAGHDTLVSTGDIVDRGDDTIALYKLFQSLRYQSERSGGEVRNLVGNHEVMNALGDWRYVTPGDIESFGGAQARRLAMSTKGWIGQDWLKHYNVTAVVPLLPPDHKGLPKGYEPPRVSFVHGGITPEYAQKGVDEMNRIGMSFIKRALDAERPTGWVPDGTTKEEMQLWSENGPLWFRGYATDSDDDACALAANATDSLRVRHLVMGHTPSFKGFVVRCPSSAILLIDTGISRAYGGEQSALVIDFELIPIQSKTNKAAKKQWKEYEMLTALYKGRAPKVIERIEKDLWL